MKRKGAALIAALMVAMSLSTPAAAAPTRYEAENAVSSGCLVESNHAGFSGSGFVNCANASGQFVEWTVNAASAGTASLSFRHANGSTANRPADIRVNGSVVRSGLAFNPTGAWSSWATVTITAEVNAGSNTIRLTATDAAGPSNLDYLDFEMAVAPSEYQAENCTISQGVVESNWPGFTGTGFVNTDNVIGSYVQCGVTVAEAGNYALTFRYANGTTTNRPMALTVNGASAGSMNFPGTGAWSTWQNATATASLSQGTNTVRVTATTSNGGPNLDRLSVSQGPPPGTPGMAAAPYEYFGWGSPQDPVTVMNVTGIRWLTLAFILSDGGCNPAWDGSRPLTGGNDQNQINRVRANGGDVVVSFGGWSGNKLGERCSSASALAGAYQKVINAYGLKAIDIDIENTEFQNHTVQQRVVDALKIVKASNPGITTMLTIGTAQSGPDSWGQALISKAATSGLDNNVWVVMPFDFGGGSTNMGTLSIQATTGLKDRVKAAYGYTDDQAWRRSGLSSMNGKTDVSGELVRLEDFQQMLTFAGQRHLARFTFWSVNRDRPCTSGSDPDSCSGAAQQPYDYTKIIAQYQG